MFDFRYHALSLAAVFLALVVGLLLGVAIGDQGLVSSAERDVRDSLRKDVRDARADAAQLRGQLAERDRLETQLYPLMVGGRLPGQRVGVIALCGVPDTVVDDVRDALGPTGARLVQVTVVRIPPDTNGLAGDLRGTRFANVARDPKLLERFGRRIGVDFVNNGAALKRVRGPLLESSSGTSNGLGGVVLYRQGGEVSGEAGTATTAFEDGLVAGLKRTDVPLVGVEESSRNPSGVPWLKDHGISSVDDVDELTGRASMVFVLAGASGAFGTDPTADRLLPEAPGANGS
jgi:Copper transport outer membrane protein, MctB